MPPRACLLALCLTAASAWAADPVALQVVTPRTVAPGRAAELAQLTRELLSELSALSLLPRDPGAAACAPGELACFLKLAEGQRADYVLQLRAEPAGTRLTLELTFFDRVRRKLAEQGAREVAPDALRAALGSALAKLLPAHARRGWGGVLVEAPPGARVKVDGQRVATTPLAAPLPVTAGLHQVDVLFPSGAALLQRAVVPEGGRLTLGAAATPLPQAPLAGPRTSGLQLAAAGLWSAGTLAIAGSLVAGALALSTSNQLDRCTASSRECLQLGSALELQRQADAYNGTANVLLISGASAATLAVGVFAWDVMAQHPGK